MTIGETLDKAIQEQVERVLNAGDVPDTEYIQTDNLGEVVEKLVILHIRTWMLEDLIQEAQTDADVASLKNKIDICFKQKRPRFVEAINLLVDNAIRSEKSLREDSVKIYNGVA